jgi:hypothetical protein
MLVPVLRCDAAGNATVFETDWRTIICLVQRPTQVASPPAARRSKARAYTYLCCEDGVDTAAVGWNSGGGPL